MFDWILLDVFDFALLWGSLLFMIFATRPKSNLLFKKPHQEKIKRDIHIIAFIGLLISVCAAIVSIILGAIGYE